MNTRRILSLLAVVLCGSPLCAQEAKNAKFTLKTEWKGERITLPADFAPDMKLKGIEEIRFAPGMFEADSETFFSYVFAFAVSADQQLSKAVIEAEMLAYYRGLAGGLLKRKGKEVDVSKFTFKMEQSKAAVNAPTVVKAESVTQYVGKLDWIEPFATAKPQILHFELQAWSDAKTKSNYLFVCTSPKAIADESAIWKEMRKIRSAFEFAVE